MSKHRQNRPLTSINIPFEDDVPPEENTSRGTPEKRHLTVAKSPPTTPPENNTVLHIKRKNDSSALAEDLPRDLALPSLSKSRKRAMHDTVTRQESPWGSYKRVYECDLAGTVIVVTRRSRPRKVHSLRQFPGSKLDEPLRKLLFTHHENIASALEQFVTPEWIFVISDFIPLTLGHVVACRHYPDEKQINAIMTQVRGDLRSF